MNQRLVQRDRRAGGTPAKNSPCRPCARGERSFPKPPVCPTASITTSKGCSDASRTLVTRRFHRQYQSHDPRPVFFAQLAPRGVRRPSRCSRVVFANATNISFNRPRTEHVLCPRALSRRRFPARRTRAAPPTRESLNAVSSFSRNKFFCTMRAGTTMDSA